MNRKNVLDYDELVAENRKLKLAYPTIIQVDDKVLKVQINKNMDGMTKYNLDSQICNFIQVLFIKNDMDSNEKIAVIQYKNLSGKIEQKECTCDLLSDKNKVVSLSKYGMDISTVNALDIIKHFNNQMKMASERLVSKKLGIISYQKKDVFVGANVFSKNEMKINLSYQGKMLIEQKGSSEKYKQMLDKEVVQSTFLSTMLAIGCTAPLIGFIGEKCNVNNLLVHISGDSSQGKSTALQLALSAFGPMRGRDGKNSIYASWNTTINALQEMLAGNYGIPMGLDEAGMSKNKQFASIIYTLVEGREKQRMEFNVGNKDVREWRTVIISTGEFKLKDASDNATGQGIRQIIFEGVPWTDDAEQSNRIKSEIQNNYGFLGEEFALKMLKIGRENLLANYLDEVNQELKDLKCGTFNSRIASSLALIVLSAKILRKLGVMVEVSEIRQFLIKTSNETKGANETLGQRAYDCIITEITIRQNQIEKRAINGHPLKAVPIGEIWAVGYCDSVSSEISKIALPKNTCDDFLKSKSFNNLEAIYTQWIKSKYVQTDKRGGIINKVKIGDVTNERCICILLH